jgi:hypothetical protein
LTLPHAKRLSLVAAALIAGILAVVDLALIDGRNDHAANCDCGGGAVVLLLLGLVAAVCVIAIVVAAGAWLAYFAKRRGESSETVPATGWWTRVLILDGALLAFALAYPFGLGAGLLAATALCGLSLVFERARGR